MRGLFFSLGVLVALVFVASTGLRAEESPQKLDEYLPPEHFEAQQKLGEYPAHAKKFLADHPQDPRCSRVLLDVLMVTTLANQPEVAKQIKLRLLMYYTSSMQTQYVVKTTPVQDLKGLLKERFTASDSTLDRDALDRFLEAIKLCTKFHGAAIGDDELWAQAALAAPDAGTAARLKGLIKQPGRAADTVAIVLDTQLTLQDKFIALQELQDFNTARAFQRYLFSQLTDEERGEVNVRAVVVESLLRDQKFADAVPLLAELCPQSREPKHYFWHAWALGASEEPEAAQDVIATLQKDFPNDDWAKAGGTLSEILQNIDTALREQAKVLNATVSQFLSAPPEVFEATVLWRDGGEQVWCAYVGVDLPQDALEFVTTTGDRTRFAYRVGANDCQLFVDGDASIHRYQTRGLCPIITSALQPKAGGGFNYNFNFNTAPQGSGALRQSLHNMLVGTPLLATDAGRRQLLQHAVRSGNFPRKVQKDGEQLVLDWYRPRIDSPVMHKLSARVTSERRLASITNEQGSGLVDIRYGASADVKLTAPRWPERPLEAIAEFSGQDMFRLFGAMMALMQDKPPAAEVAGGKPPQAR